MTPPARRNGTGHSGSGGGNNHWICVSKAPSFPARYSILRSRVPRQRTYIGRCAFQSGPQATLGAMGDLGFTSTLAASPEGPYPLPGPAKERHTASRQGPLRTTGVRPPPHPVLCSHTAQCTTGTPANTRHSAGPEIRSRRSARSKLPPTASLTRLSQTADSWRGPETDSGRNGGDSSADHNRASAESLRAAPRISPNARRTATVRHP